MSYWLGHYGFSINYYTAQGEIQTLETTNVLNVMEFYLHDEKKKATIKMNFNLLFDPVRLHYSPLDQFSICFTLVVIQTSSQETFMSWLLVELTEDIPSTVAELLDDLTLALVA